jgi:hypothetical protein
MKNYTLNSAQVMTLTSDITLATLFLGLSPHFVLREMVNLNLFLQVGYFSISTKRIGMKVYTCTEQCTGHDP